MAQQEQNVIVLVADDEPSTLALVASHVRSRGYTVLEASDGDQAWQLAHEHLPDLVILDVMMPGMSGWEVCRKIREAVSLAHTGVIMLTGIGENLNEMTSPLYGADTYLDKPFEFTTLDEKVVETLADRRKGAMGRPDPEIAASRESSRPPPPKTNGLVLTRARSAPKAKKPAKPKDAAPREAARPLVKTSPRKEPAAAAKPAKSSPKAEKRSTPKAAAKAKPVAKAKAKPVAAKAAPRKAKAVKAKSAKPLKTAARKGAAKKAAKAAPKKVGARAAGKKGAAKKASAPKKAVKAAPKAAPTKRAAPKKAAPKAAAASKKTAVSTPAAPRGKKRKAPATAGDATV